MGQDLDNSVISKAYEIAARDLKSCYSRFGIVAGKRNYDDYWTRDAGFASQGALALGDFEIVKRHLELLIRFEKKGAIPFLIREYFPGSAFVGRKIPVRLIPCYRSHKFLWLSEVIDSNAYFVIMLCEFAKASKNEKFFLNRQETVEKALKWYLPRMDRKSDLVKENYIASWNDGIYKKGVVLTTNAIVYKAFESYLDLCQDLGVAPDRDLAEVFLKMAQGFQKVFFNGEFFSDWVDRKKYDYFDAAGNLLAIIYDLADEKQAEKILDFVKEKLYHPPLMKLCHPRYPLSKVELGNLLFGMKEYWRGKEVFWSDHVCLYALALIKQNKASEGEAVLAGFSKLVQEHNGIYEIYDRKFSPFSAFFYRAEHPYARGAGLLVMAVKALKRK